MNQTSRHGIVESRGSRFERDFSRSVWRITLNFLEHFIPDSKRTDFVRDIRDDWPHYFGRIVQSATPKGFSIKSFAFWSKEEISESNDLLEIIGMIYSVKSWNLARFGFSINSLSIGKFQFFNQSSVNRLSQSEECRRLFKGFWF